MNQQCKVCGEPAAGFHFGAFTCEGCKSFFGRSYNNLSSISECKNNGECVINKKNRTACKACRLRKCLLVGMSKSGSRYGRRSNWFKIHCLLQEQQQQAQQAGGRPSDKTPPPHPALSMLAPPFPPHLFPGLHGRPPCSKEELMLLGLDEYKKSTSPSISSPDSHHSDSSINVDDSRRHQPSMFSHKMPGLDGPTSMASGKDMFMPLSFGNLGSIPGFPPTAAFLPPPSAFNALSASHQHLLFPGAGFHPALYPHHQGLLKAATNNNNRYIHNNNNNNNNELNVDSFTKRFYLDAVLKSQRSSPSSSSIKSNHVEIEPEEIEPEVNHSPKPIESPIKPVPITLANLNFTRGLSVARKGSESPIQENPMDLSMKSGSFSSDERRQTPSGVGSDILDPENDDDDIASNGMRSNGSASDADEELELSKEREVKRIKIHRSTPLDLTTKV